MSDVLKPFGYDVLQIDDGYQREPIGVPANWLNTNDKFPGGVDGLRGLIAARGLTPGIWTNTTFHNRAWSSTGWAFSPADRLLPARPRWASRGIRVLSTYTPRAGSRRAGGVGRRES